MTKLTDLRGSECLPKKKENSMRYSGHTVNAFNEVVSQLEQVELCVDEEELAKEIWNLRPEKFKAIHVTSDDLIFIAKSLSQSKEKWLKLEICPADRKGN